ncbi:hypothetical protein FJR48_09020 [Sulfurimonas lithotrophica]|uniref:Uncharacterized protein n=1 Tax=Sulfurimonas lithotrophica TaxID=2590022 RepID=A0A5P8P2L1_9BACT|nr:hypothetical protein [Sulfurimonas lithotrophica]QFR49861.1 hypothetical protein FJR48_09020 [Sulfurimonas lithotrophica]
MQVGIESTLLSIHKDTDFKDKETGEVITEGKYKLNLLVETELNNGEKKSDIIHVSIPNDKRAEYETKIGKKIQVKCNYVSKSPVSFYVS